MVADCDTLEGNLSPACHNDQIKIGVIHDKKLAYLLVGLLVCVFEIYLLPTVYQRFTTSRLRSAAELGNAEAKHRLKELGETINFGH